MATLTIPVRYDLSAYKFQIELEAVLYTLEFRYNQRLDRWFMSIADNNEEPLLTGIKLMHGLPLLARYKDPSLPPGEFWLIDESGEEKNPGRTDLGNDCVLFYEENE